MKKSIADKWIRALRSGKYKQGTRVLHNEGNNTYCCLGVLCKIEGIKSSDPQVIASKKNPLKTSTGCVDNRYGNTDLELTALNDSGLPAYAASLTFDEIADVIQMTYKEL